MKNLTRAVLAASALALALGFTSATAAPALPWGKDIALFYPGQSSWEWATTIGQHPGAEKFRAGKNCAACHIGDEKTMGALLVSGKQNEPSPIAGKPGSVNAKVAFGHDDQNMYVHIDFSTAGQPNAKMDAGVDTRVTVMIADAALPVAARAGCWGACHNDSAGMESAAPPGKTMYLSKAGNSFEYWQARLNPGAAAVGESGTIADKMTDAKPSAVTADATNSGGTWSVTMTRKLNGSGIELVPGKKYIVAFAIHTGHAAKRFHYVSFERTMVLDSGAADFVAQKI
jgi:Ethylbenzene dehydrogenase